MQYKYLTLLAGIFTATLVLTNILNTKIFALASLTFPAGILTFPLTFLAADALTEVYGYKATRQVIWAGFFSLVFMAIAISLTIALPPASFWPLQDAYASTLNQVPRLVIASIIAYWCGEFCNSFVLAKSKVTTNGKGMPVRFITSTMAGQAIDTIVFMSIAFIGVFPPSQMLTLFITSWVFKVLWELIALPISVPFVSWLKAVENTDHFDRNTNFNPFSIENDPKDTDQK